MHTPIGSLEIAASMVGVKQGCPQTPTPFRVYLDEIYNYIEILGCSGACFVRIAISILLYANDIVVLFDSRNYKDI